MNLLILLLACACGPVASAEMYLHHLLREEGRPNHYFVVGENMYEAGLILFELGPEGRRMLRFKTGEFGPIVSELWLADGRGLKIDVDRGEAFLVHLDRARERLERLEPTNEDLANLGLNEYLRGSISLYGRRYVPLPERGVPFLVTRDVSPSDSEEMIWPAGCESLEGRSQHPPRHEWVIVCAPDLVSQVLAWLSTQPRVRAFALTSPDEAFVPIGKSESAAKILNTPSELPWRRLGAVMALAKHGQLKTGHVQPAYEVLYDFANWMWDLRYRRLSDLRHEYAIENPGDASNIDPALQRIKTDPHGQIYLNPWQERFAKLAETLLESDDPGTRRLGVDVASFSGERAFPLLDTSRARAAWFGQLHDEIAAMTPATKAKQSEAVATTNYLLGMPSVTIAPAPARTKASLPFTFDKDLEAPIGLLPFGYVNDHRTLKAELVTFIYRADKLVHDNLGKYPRTDGVAKRYDGHTLLGDLISHLVEAGVHFADFADFSQTTFQNNVADVLIELLEASEYTLWTSATKWSAVNAARAMVTIPHARDVSAERSLRLTSLVLRHLEDLMPEFQAALPGECHRLLSVDPLGKSAGLRRLKR